MTTVVVDVAGNVALPEELRTKLGWDRGTELELSEDASGAVTLRPVGTEDSDIFVDEYDGFVFGPGEVAKIKRARERAAAGHERQLTKRELREILGIEVE